MHAALRRATALLLLAVLPLTGCTAWSSHYEPRPGDGGSLPDPVRVRSAGTGTTVLHDATVRGDSIVGFTGRRESGARVAIAADDVEWIESRRFDPLRTGVALVGVAAGTVVALFVITYHRTGGFQ